MHHPPDTLHARKRRKARAAIVSAAFRLFAEHGFDNVTVAAIAEHAEVGRTTFFRYFGDKQQVVFADTADEVDRVCAHIREKSPLPAGDDLSAALSLLREAGAAARPPADQPYTHAAVLSRLMRESPELRSRHLLLQQRRADRMADALMERGVVEAAAVVAAQTATACELAAMRLSGGPEDVSARLEEAYELLGPLLESP